MSNLLNLSVKLRIDGVPSILHPGGPHAPNTFDNYGFKPGELHSFNITKSDNCTSSKANVTSIVGFYLDFDLKDWLLARSGHTSSSAEGVALLAAFKESSYEDRVPELEAFLSVVLEAVASAVGVEPTYITCTGGGFHVGYWYENVIEKNATTQEETEKYVKAVINHINQRHVHSASQSVGVCTDEKTFDISRNERDIGSVKGGTGHPTHLIFWNPSGVKLTGPDAVFAAEVKDYIKKRDAEDRSAKSRADKAERKAKEREEKRAAMGLNSVPEEKPAAHQGEEEGGEDGEGGSGENTGKPKFSGDWTTFDIERLFTRTGREIRRKNGQLEIDCPFKESRHPNSEGNAKLRLGVPAANGNKGTWADFICHHSACGGKGIHRLGDAIKEGIFTIEEANSVSNPLSKIRKEFKRGGLLPTGSDESVANAFMASMPYAMDSSLAYFGEDFYSYNPEAQHWAKLHEVRVPNDIAQYFDNSAYSAGINSSGDEKFGYWLANNRAVEDVVNVLARKCKALPASQKFKEPTPGVMFTNGFLYPNGMFETDAEITKELGCTAAQAIDYDWDENDKLDCGATKMEAEMPLFCAYMKGVLGVDSMDHPDIVTLLEYPGLCLLGLGAATQKVLVPHGVPGSGKSTYMNIIRSYFDALAVCIIHPQQTSGQFQLSELIGRRINLVDDVSAKTVYDSSRFKTMATGGQMVAEFKGINRREYFFPIAGSILNLNDKLKTASADAGFVDRLHPIHFPNRFRGVVGKENVQLSVKIIKQEREVILRYIIRRALLALRDRQGQLASRADDTVRREQMMSDSDSAWRFLSEACVVGPEKKTKPALLFQQYINYCINTNTPPNERKTMRHFCDVAIEFGENRKIDRFKDRTEEYRFYRIACEDEMGQHVREGMR